MLGNNEKTGEVELKALIDRFVKSQAMAGLEPEVKHAILTKIHAGDEIVIAAIEEALAIEKDGMDYIASFKDRIVDEQVQVFMAGIERSDRMKAIHDAEERDAASVDVEKLLNLKKPI